MLKAPEEIVKDAEIPVFAKMRYNEDGQSEERPNPLLAQFENTESIRLTEDIEYYMVTVCFTSDS